MGFRDDVGIVPYNFDGLRSIQRTGVVPYNLFPIQSGGQGLDVEGG